MSIIDRTAMDRRGFIGACAAGTLATLVPASARAAGPRTVAFADGSTAPALGQGSWHMASGATPPDQAEDAMRLGISLGMTLIDTSDNYGAGRSEEMVGKAIAGLRDKIFLVSKLDPEEATADGTERALEASLKRLGVDKLDLYLLHQRRGADVAAAVKGLEGVRAKGLTKRWGVSNFSAQDMEQLFAVPGGERCATNQVLYNVAAREIEADLIPWCDKHHMPIMAYSPLGAGGKGALLGNAAVKQLAAARGVGPSAILLAWAMRDGRTMAITETGSSKHVRENAAAATLELSAAEIKTIDDAFPPPRAG